MDYEAGSGYCVKPLSLLISVVLSNKYSPN